MALCFGNREEGVAGARDICFIRMDLQLEALRRILHLRALIAANVPRQWICCFGLPSSHPDLAVTQLVELGQAKDLGENLQRHFTYLAGQWVLREPLGDGRASSLAPANWPERVCPSNNSLWNADRLVMGLSQDSLLVRVQNALDELASVSDEHLDGPQRLFHATLL